MTFRSVSREHLFDFKVGDWIGVRYEPPKSPDPNCQERDNFEFPTIVSRIDDQKDTLYVESAPQACPTELIR